MLKYVTTDNRKAVQRYRDDDKFKIMGYSRASDVIRVIDGRYLSDGELPGYITLECAWWAIAEGLAIAKGSDIDFYSVLDYVRRRSSTNALFQNEEIILEQIKTVCKIIDKKPTKYKLTRGEIIGRNLKLTAKERKTHRAYTMIAIDQPRSELKAMRKRTQRLVSRNCMAKKRLAAGATPRAESLSRTKPWKALGISRRTWERRGKPLLEPTAEIVQLYPDKM
jgi:hypothetical protein